MAENTETITAAVEASNALPNELIGLLLVLGIIFTAIVVLMRKSPFYIVGRILIFLTQIVSRISQPIVRLLRLMRIISRAKVKTAAGTAAPGPSIGVAFARTVTKKTETDITLETGFSGSIDKLRASIIRQVDDLLKSNHNIPKPVKEKIQAIDPDVMTNEYLGNKFEDHYNVGELDFVDISSEENDTDNDQLFQALQHYVLRKALSQLTEREDYELRILREITSRDRELYIHLDDAALKDLRQTKRALEERSGLVFSKLDIQDIIDDEIYEEEDKSGDASQNEKSEQAADKDLIKAKYFFTYDVPVRRKLNPQSLYEDVEASNIIELLRFSDRKNFYVLSQMRKLINANIMKLSVLLSAVLYVVFIINIFFSASIPFTKGFIMPYLPQAIVETTIKPDQESLLTSQQKSPNSSGSFIGISKDKVKDKSCTQDCQSTLPVVRFDVGSSVSFYIEARSIDKGLFGILSCLLGMFIMWLFYKKEYTEFQLYNGNRLDNFMQRCLNRISVNYQITVANNVLSMQRPDNLENMIDNSSKWTTLLPWISFRAFYLEYFLRNVMYQILRNSSYYLLFIPVIFFMVIIATAYAIDLETFRQAALDQNTFYFVFLLLIYLYYRYLKASVTFILDTIKEETWQEFHKLKVQNSMKRYVQAWAQNLKQWRDARKSSDGH